MDANKLRYFAAVVDTGSIVAAAKSLFVSPQAVSKAIISIEHECQAPLLLRKGHKTVPTEEGSGLYLLCQDLFSCLDAIDNYKLLCSKQGAQSKTPAEIVQVACGLPRAYADWFRPSTIPDSHQSKINAQISLRRHDSGLCLSLLHDKTADIAIVPGTVEHTGIETQQLFNVPLGIEVDRNHPLANKSSVDIQDLNGYKIAPVMDIRYCEHLIDQLFFENGLSPDFCKRLNSFDDFAAFLENQGVAFVYNTKMTIPYYAGTVIKPLNCSALAKIPITCAYRSNESRPSVMTALRSIKVGSRIIAMAL